MTERLFGVDEQLTTVERLVMLQPEIAGLQLYEYLRSDAADQKAAFMSGEQAELKLDYADLNDHTISRLAIPAEMALRTLMPNPSDEKTDALYRAIEYRQSEMALMGLAAEMQRTNQANPGFAELTSWFRQTNEALYGAPDKKIFSTIAHKSFDGVLGERPEDNHTKWLIRAELRAQIGEIDDSDYEIALPDQEVVERLGKLVSERFEPIYEHIDPDATYNVPAMAEALEEALARMGAKELGWRTVIVPRSSSLATSAHRKLIEVGEGRPELSGEELRSLVLHELGVHAGRSISAEKAGWLSAAYGQDGYLDFEEAMATAMEDAYLGKVQSRGEPLYLNYGLAYGLDNHEPRDFRGVFEAVWRLKYLKGKATDKTHEERIAKAQSAAFASCLRIFRGTPTNIPGLTYNKDLAYFKGQALVWPLLSQVRTAEDLDFLLCGKLDLTRGDHVPIAHAIMKANAA